MVLVSGILVGAEVSPVEWLFLQEGSTLLGVEESTSRRPRAIACPRLIRRRSPLGWNGRGLRALRLAGVSRELLFLPRGHLHSRLLKYRPRFRFPLIH